MLEALDDLPFIKKAIKKTLENGKVYIITDNESRIELGFNESNILIRLFIVHRPNKVKLKTSLYVVINSSSLPIISRGDMLHEGKEDVITITDGKADVSKQLSFIKKLSNFMNTL